MKLLITGASGFLGKRILARAVMQGINVHAMGRSPVQEKVDFSEVDIRDRQDVMELMRSANPTHVLHLASLGVTRDNSTLEDLLLTNTIGTDNVLNAATALPNKPYILMLGTAYEYESSEIPLSENARVNPKSPYAISKTASAFCMSNYAAILPMLYLRLFNVYGPGEPSERIIPYIVNRAREDKPVDLTGCEQLRDFMFLDDLVDIIFKLLFSPRNKNIESETFNIGTGIPVSLKELVFLVAENLRFYGIDVDIRFGALPYRKGDPMICVADNTRLLEKIGYFDFTSLNEGVRKTVEELL